MKCLSIHFTDLCNSRCAFCVVASPAHIVEAVQYDDIVRFLTQHKDRGYSIVNLHGGEPTIHPKFLQALRLILKLGYKEVYLQTNGITLARKDFCKRLIDLSVTRFVVSIHGGSAQIHDSQTRTPGGFNKTVRGIKNLKALGAYVQTTTVITLHDVTRLKAIAQLACALGVDHINFSNLHPVGSACDCRGTIMARFDQIREYLYPALEFVRRHGRKVTLEGFPYCSISGEDRERLHLSNEFRVIKMLVRGKVIDDYDQFMRGDMRVFGKPCECCSHRRLCGGVYPEYIEYFGWSEFKSAAMPALTNSLIETRQ